jgi:phosphoglucomutase
MPSVIEQRPAVSPMAGRRAPKEMLVDVLRLAKEYYTRQPDLDDRNQFVSLRKRGHRACSFQGSFNEAHILAIAQAICDYRSAEEVDGPLYMGKDKHALFGPAQHTAIEVLAADRVETVTQRDDGVTPTPVISRAILAYNRARMKHLADGIVITPSHNPSEDGGFKYKPTNGGPADTGVTLWVQDRANDLLRDGNANVKRMPFDKAIKSGTTHEEDLVMPYVRDLAKVLDIDAISGSGLRLAVDPLGGAAQAYWDSINSVYGLDIAVVNQNIDPTFSFMTVDHDERIRMDCSSLYARARLIGLEDRYQVAFATDPDADRHATVVPSAGLFDPSHYLAVAIRYLLTNRPEWRAESAVGKTLVSPGMIDRVVQKLGRQLCDVPVGFKWFTTGLRWFVLLWRRGEFRRRLSQSRRQRLDHQDGLIMSLLAAEITTRTNRRRGGHYRELTAEFATPYYTRIDTPATPAQKAKLEKLSPEAVKESTLAGDVITAKLTRAPGNNAPIGGLKVVAANGWFAARPSGTENIYKIYAESFRDEARLDAIVAEAREAPCLQSRSSPAAPYGRAREPRILRLPTSFTLKRSLLKALAKHSALGSIPADGGNCEEVLAQFGKAGVDIDSLAARLQQDGAKSFVNPGTNLWT